MNMVIKLNGEAKEIDADLSLAKLVEQLALTGQRYAVEVNLEIIPKAEHAITFLKEGDKVEVVQAIGGG